MCGFWLPYDHYNRIPYTVQVITNKRSNLLILTVAKMYIRVASQIFCFDIFPTIILFVRKYELFRRKLILCIFPSFVKSI